MRTATRPLPIGVRFAFTLPEWSDETFPGVHLTPEGRVLATRLAEERQRRIEVSELRHGLRVRTRSWVGVVRLHDVELRVVPKLAGDPSMLARLLEISLGVDGLVRLRGRADLDLAGKHLLDLVCLLFAEACAEIVRRGLLTDYVEREEELPCVRGRILADRQILQRFGKMDRIACRFDEIEHDIDENRLLAAALRVAHHRAENPSIRRRIARLRAIFEPVCDESSLDPKEARQRMVRSFYHRLNAAYSPAHRLAWLLLEGTALEDLMAPGAHHSFAFLLDMNVLFERFAERLVERALPSACRLDAQASHRAAVWDMTAHRSYQDIRPDFLVRPDDHRHGSLAIDAKYKLYDVRNVDRSDIYQTFLYAYVLGQRLDGAAPAGLIFYPASADRSRPLRLRVQTRQGSAGAVIEALGIRIPAALDEMSEGREGLVLESVRATIERLLWRSSKEERAAS